MKIDKNIPIIGGKSTGKTRCCEEILEKFKIGDSTLIPSADQSIYRVILDRIVREKKLPNKYSFKKWDAENYRVWRTQ